MKTKLTLFVTVLAAALFEVGCASTEPAFVSVSLVAYYPFNGNAKDESGNGNHGEVKGPKITTDRHGKPASAYSFDGKDDFIDFGDKDVFDFGTSDFTISVWFQTSGPPGNTFLIGKYNPAKIPAYGVGTAEVGNGYAYMGDSSSWKDARGNVNLTDGNWHHMLVAFDRDSKMAIYVDGDFSVSSNISLQTGSISNAINLVIGKGLKDSHFAGKIDDARLYKRALSAEEVKAIYDLEKPKGK